jgi:hypothetical protein
MLQFKIFEPYGLRMTHGVTWKNQGSFNDEFADFAHSAERLSKALKLKNPITAQQIHTDKIVRLEKEPMERLECDAFITNKADLNLMVKVADCQGLIIYDPATHTVAAVHSGWKGSAANIIGKTVARMVSEYGVKPIDLVAGISPSLGSCCAEFTDPEKELPAFCKPFTKDKKVDFWSLSMKQLKDAGLLVRNIEVAAICTKCDVNTFSHRRKENGRMGVFVQLK